VSGHTDPLADSNPPAHDERQMDEAALAPETAQGVQPAEVRGAGFITRNGHVVID